MSKKYVALMVASSNGGLVEAEYHGYRRVPIMEHDRVVFDAVVGAKVDISGIGIFDESGELDSIIDVDPALSCSAGEIPNVVHNLLESRP